MQPLQPTDTGMLHRKFQLWPSCNYFLKYSRRFEESQPPLSVLMEMKLLFFYVIISSYLLLKQSLRTKATQQKQGFISPGALLTV